MSQNQGYPGSASQLTGGGSLYNAINFMIQNQLALNASAHVAKVVAIVEGSGGVDNPPMVKCQIMVDDIDGYGNRVERAVLYNLPAYRSQSGTNAVIIDPQVGDIGMLVVADRDISGVKSTKANAGPGSFRQNNWADSCFHSGYINKTPVAYIQFTNEGVINIITPMDINITNQGNITVQTQGNLSATVHGNTTVTTTGNAVVTASGTIAFSGSNASLDTTGNLSVNGFITAKGDITAGSGGESVDLLLHVHSASGGDGIGGPPVPG
jgi:hypothetical protein